MLDFEPSDEAAAALIASSAPLWHEARAALPALRNYAAQKAGEDGVRQVIGRRFSLYPQPDRSEMEWAAWWADYYDVLADVSLPALEAAMLAYVRDPKSEFMPKPGKLLELARETPNPAAKAYGRAYRAVNGAPPEDPYAKGPTEESVREVKAMLAEYLDAFKSKLAEPAKAEPLPSIAGKADETGITPEMRALMARREGREP